MKKLKKILLINWLYFSKELIEVGDVNFLTGKNGAGKSTVIDALQIVLLGETNARNFNQAANEKSQRTLDGYLRADMDENSPYSRRGKDFSTYIACEYYDDIEDRSFVTGVTFDCRSDGSRQERFFIYVGGLPENCFIEHGEAMDLPTFRKFLKEQYSQPKIYDTQKEYRTDMLSRWNVHNEQALRMLKKAVSFRPITDIEKFITENICDVPDKPDIDAMQQNIRDYKRHELLAQRQEEKLAALQEIGKLYQDMNQAMDRWRVQSFLVQWAEKETQQGKIDRLEVEKKDCTQRLVETERKIQELTENIQQKDQRRQELELATAQSDVFQEERRLTDQKTSLLNEQQKLMGDLQEMTLEIRRDAAKQKNICNAALPWDSEELLLPVLEASAAAETALAPLQSGDYEIFAHPLSLFETAQQAVANLLDAIRTAAHKAEDILNELRAQQEEKHSVLENLRHNIKDYPRGLLPFKQALERALEKQMGHQVPLNILADVLEISDERWRGAVEGYLNNQKFYLLVEPSAYPAALAIYDRLKQNSGSGSFGLVDIGKLREREKIEAKPNSLARKVETENPLARTYVDYLLGRVICCDQVQQLREYRTAITAEGMLYQGYVARALRRDWMEDAFIGRRAVNLRIDRLEKELIDLRGKIQYWSPVYQELSGHRDSLFTEAFVQTIVTQRQRDYLRGLSITQEVAEIETQLSRLDLLWLGEQRRNIGILKEEIASLGKEKDGKNTEKGKLEGRIHQLDYDTLPEYYQSLTAMEDRIQDTFPLDYQQSVGIPRYQQEVSRLHRADTVYQNFRSSLAQSEKAQEDTQRKLFSSRREYVEHFRPCSFHVECMDNDEYEAERKVLEESELPTYKEKIRAARESAMEQFQNDFLNKLSGQIEQVQDQVKRLNRALRQAKFGTDSYQFRVDRNPDYAQYYDMIMSPESKNSDLGLFALPLQEKYGPLIETLFSQITMADDSQLNSRQKSELQENIQRYTDFRTYLKFDLETTDQNGSRQLLSQTLNTKSGGETQTPFYIAVLASFAQLYRVNTPSDFGNTVRLVVFDEAFNKMDSDRITESVRLLREMGLQAIICTPPDKVADIMPIADRTLLVNKDKYRMHVLPFGKEVSQ